MTTTAFGTITAYECPGAVSPAPGVDDPQEVIVPNGTGSIDRSELFWSRVTKSDGCWLWTGQLNNTGYGMFYVRPQKRCAHRIAYELVVGPIPEGLELDHLCRTPACVRPDHLEPVTHAENTRRAGAAKTSCPQGHVYNDANTQLRPNGNRRCATCHREEQRRYKAERLARDAKKKSA